MIKSNSTIKWLEKVVVKVWMAIIPRLPVASRSKTTTRPASILITKTCCFGDAVLTLYAIRKYKERYPQVSIDILCSIRIAAVYATQNTVRKVFTVPVTGRGLWREIFNLVFLRKCFRLVRELKKNRYDMLIDMELYRGYPVILKTLCKIPSSRGFKVESTYPKNHDMAVIREKHVPEWQCFHMLMGLEDSIREKPEPLFPPSKPRRVDRATLGVVFGSSFNWPQKQWPTKHFITLMNRLSRQDCKFVLFGMDHEKEQAVRIETEVKAEVQNMVGKLDFDDLRIAVSACHLIFGNDTGTMHLAAACGVPVVTFFGPTDSRKWNALTSVPVSSALECSPCYYLSAMPECPHRDCLNKLLPEQALDAIENKLKEIL